MTDLELLRAQKEELERDHSHQLRMIMTLSVENDRLRREMVKFRQDFIELMTENEGLRRLVGQKVPGEK